MAKYISLSEYQSMAGLSDSALLWLLKHNKISCQIGKNNGIQVNVDSVEQKDLLNAIASRKKNVLEQHQRALCQRFTAMLASELDKIIEEITAE